MHGKFPEDDNVEQESLRARLYGAKEAVVKLGGLHAFRTGEWVLNVISGSFRKYYERADGEYFRKKYPGRNTAFISRKLISVACKHATLIGTVVGAMVSADELVGLATAGELGVGIPANMAIALTTISAESVQVFRIQLKLVAELYRLRVPP
jgi:hypothetical protein